MRRVTNKVWVPSQSIVPPPRRTVGTLTIDCPSPTTNCGYPHNQLSVTSNERKLLISFQIGPWPQKNQSSFTNHRGRKTEYAIIYEAISSDRSHGRERRNPVWPKGGESASKRSRGGCGSGPTGATQRAQCRPRPARSHGEFAQS